MSNLSKADILTLLADNNSGDISPEDVREIVNGCLGMYAGIASSGAAALQSIGTTPTKINQFDHDLPSDGMTADFANGELTTPVDGVYMVIVSISWGGTGNSDWIVDLYCNDTAVDTTHGLRRKIGSGGDVGNAGFCTILTMASGDSIQLYTYADNPAQDFDIFDCLFICKRIG